MTPSTYFTATYAEARALFLETARAAGATIESHYNPEAGPDGGKLYTDVARFGPMDAAKVCVATSGTHGPEGFAGSGIQVGFMKNGGHDKLADGTALVLVHAVNPFGFAHIRRVNEDNVDLNRNFIRHPEDHVANERYDEARASLAPNELEGSDIEAVRAFVRSFIADKGARELLETCSGQYNDPKGLFYGGLKPAWSNNTLTAIVKKHCAQAKLVAYIDLHTGLGPHGYGEPISYHAPDEPQHQKAVAWLGESVTTPLGGSASVPKNRGKTGFGVIAALPDAEVVCVTLEFGTSPTEEVFGAIRAENWLQFYGERNSDIGRAFKAEMRRVFYPDTDAWKAMVWERGDEILSNAVAGLGKAKPI